MATAELEHPIRSTSTTNRNTTMKALVYHGPDKSAWEDKPRPTIQDPVDAIVRVTTSTICGTDLHILKGDLPAVTDGRILGHEGIGVIEEIGGSVSSFHVGDKVILSCVTACLNAISVKDGCIPSAGMAAGFWATSSMERRPSTCAFPKPTAVSTTSPQVPTKKTWPC